MAFLQTYLTGPDIGTLVGSMEVLRERVASEYDNAYLKSDCEEKINTFSPGLVTANVLSFS